MITFRNRSEINCISGHKIGGKGDFIAVYMFSGYLMFTFDVGTGSAKIRFVQYIF